LIDAGFDSTTVPDQRLTGAHDSVVFQVCQSEGRTLITLDVGFGDIREYPPEGHAGIILLRLRRDDKPWVLSVCRGLLPVLKEEKSIAGRLWIVTEHEVRIRGTGPR
jgi:Domain of unknown function (DUF5615)